MTVVLVPLLQAPSSYRVTASIGLPLVLPQSFDLVSMKEKKRRAVAESLAEGMHRGLCETARAAFEPFVRGGSLAEQDPAVQLCMQGGGGGAPTVTIEFQIDSRLWPATAGAGGRSAPFEYPYGETESGRIRKLGANVLLENRAELAISFPELGAAEKATLDLRDGDGAPDNVEKAVKSALLRKEAAIGSVAPFVTAVANSTVSEFF